MTDSETARRFPISMVACIHNSLLLQVDRQFDDNNLRSAVKINGFVGHCANANIIDDKGVN